jgi:putative transposase
MRHAWIQQHQTVYPIQPMCAALDVSISGYYQSLGRPPGEREQRRERIRRDIRKVHDQSQGIFGSWKIAKILRQRADLESACRNTVAKAMRESGLQSRIRKAFRPTTTQADPSRRPAENLLNQDFTADAPNRKWVTDITYLPTDQGWVYLAAVMDCFSRRIVGWAMGSSLATELVSAALREAIESRRPDGRRLLHHSDRGCQYTSDAYQQTLKALGITCSMSRSGCCYDNAVMERFLWSLKHEWTNHQAYADLHAVRSSVFQYIEAFYNRKRIHQALGYLTPEQYEAVYAPAYAPATKVA